MTDNEFLKMFNLLYDYLAGSLWRVREDLWTAKIPDYTGSSKSWHPALSIRKRPLISLESIPMLYGTSSESGGRIRIKGISAEYGPEHITHFGKRLVPFSPADFTCTAKKSGRLTGRMSDIKPVSVNFDKRRITDDEMKQVEFWMKMRGLWK